MTATRSIREQAGEIAGTLPALMDDVILSNKRADSPLFHAEGLRYLLAVFAHAALRGHTDDPAYPRFVPTVSLWMNFGFANPDAGYSYAQLHGDYTYRIFGRRGTARLFDIETWAGTTADFAVQHHYSGIGHLQIDRTAPVGAHEGFDIGPDGEFEVILSKDPQPGNWVRIPEERGYVIMREFFYDWENEERGQFYIERLGANYPPPPPTESGVSAGLSFVPEFVDNNVRFLANAIEAMHYALEPNTMCIQPMHLGQEERDHEAHFGLRSMRYLQGSYECGPNDAVIIEVSGIDSDYWNYYLTGHNWECIDFHTHQNSINGHQAELDRDGAFRAVISHRDPGVPNWLDPAGHESGLILSRILNLRGDLVTPRLSVVPFVELRDALPADTRVVTPEERSETIRRRMHSVRRRLCEI